VSNIRVTIQIEPGGPGVGVILPAEDVQQVLIFAGLDKIDDGEWSWAMQENEPERLALIKGFIEDAGELVEEAVREGK
jgi:hypothetical protein